jgi:hypothetical protein
MNCSEIVDGVSHGRPCFYTFPDEEDSNIFWMVPISSQVDGEGGYKEINEDKIKKFGKNNGLSFGFVRGREAAFLIQNICPVTSKYIVEEYIDCMTNNPVSIPNDLKREINAKARTLIRLSKQGKVVTLTNVIKILEILKKE